MDEKVRKLESRKKELLQAVEETKKKKQKIIAIVQGLVSELNSGKIRRDEYEEKLKQVLDNRTAEQWIKYYDDYVDYYNYQIKLCGRLIKEEKKRKVRKELKEEITVYEGWEEKKRKSRLAPILSILIGIVLIAIVVSLFINLKPVGVDVFSNIREKISGVFEAAEEKEIVKEAEIPRGRGLGRGGRAVGEISLIGEVYEQETIQYQDNEERGPACQEVQ